MNYRVVGVVKVMYSPGAIRSLNSAENNKIKVQLQTAI